MQAQLIDSMTAEQKECYELLCQVFHGRHHVTGVREWGDGIRYKPSVNLATFDFDYLTRLVVLARDRCIRVSIEPGGSRFVGIVLHKRKRDGGVFERHPTIEEAIGRVRSETGVVEP